MSLGATAVAIGAVVFVFVFGDGAPPETPSDPQPTVASSVETQPADATAGAQPAQPSDGDGGAAASQTEEQALEERQRKLVGDLRDRFAALRDDPDALIDFQTELYLVQRGRGLLPTVLSQLSELASEVESRKNELARKVFEETLTQSAKLQDEKSYGQAHELWRVPPRVIEQSGFLTRWHEEERRAESYAEKARLWDKLVAKANKYLAQGDRDIAIAILEENVPESFEAEYERIWNEREEFVREIRLKEAERIRLESEIQRKAREARIAAIRAERNKERQEKWENLLDLYPWVPLLSEGGDLENWFMTVDSIIEQGVDPFPWKNTRVGDEQVLSADARDREGEGEVYIGINGNRWLDWALEFEVQVLEGRLLLEPRNTVQAFFGAMRVQLSAEEPLVFEAADHSNWTQVRLEVRGNLVRLIENGEIKKEHYTDHDRGGFRFVLPHGGVCQIKGIRIKWVSTLDPGEEGTSEFTDEDLDDW